MSPTRTTGVKRSLERQVDFARAKHDLQSRGTSARQIQCKVQKFSGPGARFLRGERPSLAIEITRECPLRCRGCYAYEPAHLGGGVTLRELNDRKGKELIDGVLEVVDRLKPLHLSIVGGDPLVRYRELQEMVPLLLARGMHVQVVTSAFRPLPPTLGESAASDRSCVY